MAFASIIDIGLECARTAIGAGGKLLGSTETRKLLTGRTLINARDTRTCPGIELIFTPGTLNTLCCSIVSSLEVAGRASSADCMRYGSARSIEILAAITASGARSAWVAAKSLFIISLLTLLTNAIGSTSRWHNLLVANATDGNVGAEWVERCIREAHTEQIFVAQLAVICCCAIGTNCV